MSKIDTDLERDDKITAESKQFLEKVKALVDKDAPEMKKEFGEMKERLKAFSALEGVDIKKIMDQVEKQKADFDSIKRKIATNRNGLYVPGLEDYDGEFSMVRASVAVAQKNWDNAGFEKEVMDNTRAMAQKAGHVIGIDSSGGNFVPDQVIPDIITAIYSQSVLVGLEGSGQTRLSILDGLVGQPAKIPKFDGGMIAYWMGEKQEYIDSQVKTGDVTATPRKLGVLARITEEMKRFQGYGFENLFRTDMQRAAAKEIDRTVLYGRGNENEPLGLFGYPANTTTVPGPFDYCVENSSQTFPATLAGGELDFDDLDEMAGAIEDADIALNESYATIAPTRLFRRLKQLKIANYSGQTEEKGYLLGVPPTLSDGMLAGLIGDFGASTQMRSSVYPGYSLGKTPTDANDVKHGDVVVGNWSEGVFCRWSGVEIVDDGGKGTGFTTDVTYIKYRMWCDIIFRQLKAFARVADAKCRN